MTDYNIFYSWQSDLDDKFKMDQIRFIENAINKIKTADNIGEKTFLIDKATRDISGAINIVESIDAKIKECDIFIADISIINKGASKKFRKTPNPNVMYELGLAVESVGWNSIIFVMNEHFGSFDDLPFDIKTRRAITFNLPEGKKSDKTVFKTFSGQVVSAIKTCADKDTKLRLKEISNALKDSEWEAFNVHNGNVQEEVKGIVKIKQLFRHIYSFDFDSYENRDRFTLGDWKARFFVNETNLTTAELAFKSGVDFGFKTIMFPLDRKYDELFLIGQKPDYGNQVLKRKPKA